MPIGPGDIQALLKLGGFGILMLFQSFAIVVLWRLIKSKDLELKDERTKREDLMKEAIKSAMGMEEAANKMSECLARLEVGIARARID